jgi:hypothetical protein
MYILRVFTGEEAESSSRGVCKGVAIIIVLYALHKTGM